MIEPPPAPIAVTDTTGTMIGRFPTVARVVCAGSNSCTTDMSALVPPISTVMRLRYGV